MDNDRYQALEVDQATEQRLILFGLLTKKFLILFC